MVTRAPSHHVANVSLNWDHIINEVTVSGCNIMCLELVNRLFGVNVKYDRLALRARWISLADKIIKIMQNVEGTNPGNETAAWFCAL